jgi:hypothetical protein
MAVNSFCEGFPKTCFVEVDGGKFGFFKGFLASITLTCPIP